MTLSKAKKILTAVESELAKASNGHRTHVLREFTRVYEDSMTIVVDPPTGGSASQLVNKLSRIENKIEKEHKVHILIVPAHPEVCDTPKRIGVPR